MISLCSGCAVSHSNSKSTGWHSIEPLAAEMFMEGLDDREDYFRRKEVVNNLTKQIEQELRKLSQFKEQVIHTQHQIRETLELVIAQNLNSISQAEECLNAILQELDLCRYFKNLKKNNVVHDLVKKSAEFENPQVNIVTTHINTDKVINELSSIIQVDFSVENSVTQVKLNKSELYYFKPHVNEITFISYTSDAVSTETQSLSRSFYEMSGWCKVDDDHLIITGGKQNTIISREAYLIHLKDLTVVQLKPMNKHRYLHGIISTSSHLYIFGGMHKSSLKDCEVLNLSTYTWEVLPAMHAPRHGFTATLYASAIFLAGGRENDSIELFYPDTLKFVQVPVRLPRCRNCSTSVCVDDGVLIFTGDNLYMYNREGNLLDLGSIDYNVWWSNSPVVVDNTRLMGLFGNSLAMWTWDIHKEDKVKIFKL